MRTVLLVITCCVASLLRAQTGQWTIRLHNKVLLSTRLEDPVKNRVSLASKEWNKDGSFEIVFREDNKNEWYRSFLFYSETDEEILRKDSSSRIQISVAELRKTVAGHKKVIIYTTITPRDPSLAIRIRRVHLCTLQLP